MVSSNILYNIFARGLVPVADPYGLNPRPGFGLLTVRQGEVCIQRKYGTGIPDVGYHSILYRAVSVAATWFPPVAGIMVFDFMCWYDSIIGRSDIWIQ